MSDDFESLGEWGAAMRRLTSELRAGGPPVDYALLVDYVDRELDEGRRRRVVELVSTYRAWYEALWEVADGGSDDSDEGAREGEFDRVMFPCELVATPLWHDANVYRTGQEGSAGVEGMWEWELSPSDPSGFPAAILVACYGDASIRVRLTLHRVASEEADLFEPQMELRPAPRHRPLEAMVQFVDGSLRTFHWEAQTEGTQKKFSEAVDPLPIDAFPTLGEKLNGALFAGLPGETKG